MKIRFIFIALFATGLIYAQESNTKADLIAKGAKLQKAGSGYSFTEGCSVAPDGRVFFTDQPNDKIYIWDEKNGITLFSDHTERSNGTIFNKSGELVSCADLNNGIIKFSLKGIKTDVLKSGYQEKHFNGPNDLWIDSKAGIYFTDPYYFRNYWEQGHKQLQEVQGVYYLKPTGEVIRVIDDLIQPNGIVGTPDGKFLYVADIAAKNTWRYRIKDDGSLDDKTSFAPDGSDGMTIDSQGNIYLTFGKVLIYNAEGKKTGEIEVPEGPSNVCFGGKKRNILFITARSSVYTLLMKVSGVE